MGKKRKIIDIDEDDFSALSLLAGRRQQPLKCMIEEFLHHLAITAINDEFQLRIKQAKSKSLETEETPERNDNWSAYTKIAENQQDADGWMNKFEIVRQGHVPKRVNEVCPGGGTHLHIFVTEKEGDDVIVCTDCFEKASWEHKIQ